jgi:hypothetical protein
MPMPRKRADNSKKTAPRGRPFAPGVSGNPGGRPKLPDEVRAELEEMRGPLTLKAIRTLERNMDSDDGMVSNVAAREWLKKTLPDGAVALKVEVSGPEGGPVETKVVTLDDSPTSLARVVGLLRSAGVLDAGASESADTEADAVDSAEPD